MRYISECMDTISGEILADSKDYYDFAMKLCINGQMAVNDLPATSLLESQ